MLLISMPYVELFWSAAGLLTLGLVILFLDVPVWRRMRYFVAVILLLAGALVLVAWIWRASQAVQLV